MKYINSILAISTVLLLASCSEEKILEERSIRPVKFIQVGFSGNESVRTFSGTSKTDKVIHLSFRSQGVLSEFNIKLGQSVKKGQLLAKLDNVQARLNYENAISSQNSAESQMRTAKLNLNRVRALFEKGGSSLSEFEAAKDSFKTAQQSYNSTVRSVEIQQEQINYGYLYAPEDGVISTVKVELNENISTGQEIATLNSGSNMEISLGLPESVINDIQKDMSVKVSFASLGDSQFDAKVTEVSPSLDVNTATYPVTVLLANPSTEVKSGMSANVSFYFGKSDKKLTEKRLIVPIAAVGEDSKGRYVFKLNPKGQTAIAQKHQIKIGELTANGFEVIAGLKRGDKIAVAGLQTLLNGQEVKL